MRALPGQALVKRPRFPSRSIDRALMLLAQGRMADVAALASGLRADAERYGSRHARLRLRTRLDDPAVAHACVREGRDLPEGVRGG